MARARNPRNFAGMREDRVRAMAQAAFGRAFASKKEAVDALAMLPVDRQHALAKPRGEVRAAARDRAAAPYQINADAIRGGLRPPSPDKLAQYAATRSDVLRRYARAAVSIDTKSALQALTVLSRYGADSDTRRAAGRALGRLEKFEIGTAGQSAVQIRMPERTGEINPFAGDKPRAPQFVGDRVPVSSGNTGMSDPGRTDIVRARRGGVANIEANIARMSARERSDLGARVMANDLRRWATLSNAERAAVVRARVTAEAGPISTPTKPTGMEKIAALRKAERDAARAAAVSKAGKATSAPAPVAMTLDQALAKMKVADLRRVATEVGAHVHPKDRKLQIIDSIIHKRRRVQYHAELAFAKDRLVGKTTHGDLPARVAAARKQFEERLATAAGWSDEARAASAEERGAASPGKAPTVAEMRAQAKAAGVTGTSKMTKPQLMSLKAAGKFTIAGLIAAPVVAGAIAYDSTANAALASGMDGTAAQGEAIKNAAIAGGATAAVGGAIIGGIAVAARAAPVVGRVAARVALPLTAAFAAYEIGAGAVKGYREGGVAGAIKGGAMGGADFLTFGGASYLANRPAGSNSYLNASAAQGLKSSRGKSRTTMMRAGGWRNGRGWANPAVQKAAQAARRRKGA